MENFTAELGLPNNLLKPLIDALGKLSYIAYCTVMNDYYGNETLL
jgi:hypothetical protein